MQNRNDWHLAQTLKRPNVAFLVVSIAVVLVLSLLSFQRTSAQGDPLLHALQPPVVYSGSEMGVRVYPRFGEDVLSGELVVRINGTWQPVELRPAASK